MTNQKTAITKIETSSKISQKKKSKKNLKKVVKNKIEIKDKKIIKKKVKIQPKIIQEKKSMNKETAKKKVEIKDKKPKIDVEFDDGEAEVKIMTSGKEIKFHLKTTDEKEVLLEISKRTKIDINKLSKIVRFEQDD